MAATTPRKRKVDNEPTAPLADFTYTTSDGTEISLPPFKSVKPGVMRKIRKLDQADQFFTVLETVLDRRRQDQIEDARRELIAEREAAGEADAEVTDAEVLKTLDDDDTLDIIDEMDSEEFQDFQRGWFKHSGIDLGE